MNIIRSLIVAVSMYSKIPMTKVDWDEKSMRYAICFFPFVGVILALVSLGWYYLCNLVGASDFFTAATLTAISLLVTGGIHIDGYMDTMDALHSYQSKERKLEILKDPHIGAFSVIMLVLYYLLYEAAAVEMIQKLRLSGAMTTKSIEIFGLFCLGYCLTRTASGLSIVWFRSAKKEGLLYTFASTTQKTRARAILLIELIVVSGALIWIRPIIGATTILAVLAVFFFYRNKSYREFGGITGDLAGWFLSLAELAIVMIAAVAANL